MAISPGAMLEINMGIRNGDTRFMPFSRITLCSASMVWRPPMPEPTIAPQRSGSSFEKSIPESATAIFVAAMANWVNRSMRRTFFLSMKFSATNPFTSASIWQG
jgi:hypothetical protein